MLYSEVLRNIPLIKLWVGPLPFVILYHADAVEVSPFVLKIVLYTW